MNIQKEKEYLYEMMKEVSAERRRLTDIYYDLKKELDKLNDLERLGLEELNIMGFTDYLNKSINDRVIENIQRETNHIIQKIEKDNIIEESGTNVKIKEEVELMKDKRAQKRRGKSTTIGKDKQVQYINTVLREANGSPLQTKELHNRVQIIAGEKISYSTFQNHSIKAAMEKNPKIVREGKGKYKLEM